jgi:hypothetical protein
VIDKEHAREDRCFVERVRGCESQAVFVASGVLLDSHLTSACVFVWALNCSGSNSN